MHPQAPSSSYLPMFRTCVVHCVRYPVEQTCGAFDSARGRAVSADRAVTDPLRLKKRWSLRAHRSPGDDFSPTHFFSPSPFIFFFFLASSYCSHTPRWSLLNNTFSPLSPNTRACVHRRRHTLFILISPALTWLDFIPSDWVNLCTASLHTVYRDVIGTSWLPCELYTAIDRVSGGCAAYGCFNKPKTRI